MKHVIFDLGNVLINFDLNVFYRQIQTACDQSLERIAEGYISEKLEALEVGALAMEHFCKMYRFEWDLKWSPDDWANQYAKCYSPNEWGQNLAKRAKERGYSISILSNLAGFHKVGIDRTYPGFFESFDHLFFSYQMGIAKPERGIYEKVCNTLSATPEQCLFLDDKPENVEGAIQVGMKGILFDERNREGIESVLF